MPPIAAPPDAAAAAAAADERVLPAQMAGKGVQDIVAQGHLPPCHKNRACRRTHKHKVGGHGSRELGPHMLPLSVRGSDDTHHLKGRHGLLVTCEVPNFGRTERNLVRAF